VSGHLLWQVHFIMDVRELNKQIICKPSPIPKIHDLLLKLEGFQYAMSLDLNMGYYHIELMPFSKQLCTIVLPCGKYEMQCLPMSELFGDLSFVQAYLGLVPRLRGLPPVTFAKILYNLHE